MLILRKDGELFYKLYWALMHFVNERLHVVSHQPGATEFGKLTVEGRIKVRDAFLKEKSLLQSFVEQNPAHLSTDELAIVASWKHLIAGNFYVLRDLKKYTVFLSSTKGEEPIAYGVLALAQPFEQLIGPRLPVLVKTVLLPMKGQIIYDGLMTFYSISFGAGIRRSLNESYQSAKKLHGIITTLPMPAAADAPPSPMHGRSQSTKPPGKKKAKGKPPFTGQWQITSMSEWDEDDLNEESEPYIEFDAKNGGSFQFGLIEGQIDSRTTLSDGKFRIDFSWEGADRADGTALKGRGEAFANGETLVGTIFIHDGDDSKFIAKKGR